MGTIASGPATQSLKVCMIESVHYKNIMLSLKTELIIVLR